MFGEEKENYFAQLCDYYNSSCGFPMIGKELFEIWRKNKKMKYSHKDFNNMMDKLFREYSFKTIITYLKDDEGKVLFTFNDIHNIMTSIILLPYKYKKGAHA